MVEELNLLLKFPDSSMEGLKIHHSAEVSVIEAAQRLHDKGLTSHSDGGYLTDLGREAAQNASLLISLLTPR
ncbi:MAG: TIGR02647 family protein [Gammaproteobacteria bacterium]|nr:TIGR02647 family protein [Gammaproteobacteria bacterium]